MSETTKRNITAIVPLNLVHRPLDIISKAAQMAAVAKCSNVKIIFAVSPRSLSIRWILMHLGEWVAAMSYKVED